MLRLLLLAALLLGGSACGHPRRSAAPRRAQRPAPVEDVGASADSGPVEDPFRGFHPADAAASVPAYNAEPRTPATDEDAGGASTPPPPRCLELEPGKSLTLDDVLAAEPSWMRIDPGDGCPAVHVTDREVPYKPFPICGQPAARMLTVTMLGADRLPGGVDSVADPLLAVYASEELLHTDPFDCLAANDDAAFDGFLSNSSRIDELLVPANSELVIVATSAERADQHGIGAFSLILAAQPAP